MASLLSKEVVSLILSSPVDIKIGIVKNSIYDKDCEVTDNDGKYFKVTIKDFIGTYSYISFFHDPERFITWVEKKIRNFNVFEEANKTLSSSYPSEKTISEIFDSNHVLFLKFHKEYQGVTCKELLDKIRDKPDLFLWDTGGVGGNGNSRRIAKKD